MKFGLFVAAAIAAMAPAASLNAASVTVTSVVTGGPGAYTHVFSLTNNTVPGSTFYFFGVDLQGTITGTPPSWADTANFNEGWTNFNESGSDTVFNSTWCCAAIGTEFGITTTGFSVLSESNPTIVRYFVFGVGLPVTDNIGQFTFNSPTTPDTNPGYEGIVTSGAVPEPASWAMLIAGFGLVGTALRRRAAMAA